MGAYIGSVGQCLKRDMYEPMQSCNPNAMYVCSYVLSLSFWLAGGAVLSRRARSVFWRYEPADESRSESKTAELRVCVLGLESAFWTYLWKAVQLGVRTANADSGLRIGRLEPEQDA